MAMDIDKLEQMLRNSPDLLAGIIASAMDAIIVADDAQRIVLFNAAAERMLACPADEAIGASIDRFIPQRFRAEHSRHVSRYGESGVTNRNSSTLSILWGLRRTGEEFPIEAAISKVEVGGTKFFAVVIRDVTERLRAEETVRESEHRFRLVADTAPVLIWMSGTDRLCTYFNKPWLDFTGRSMDSELGNGWAEGVHPEDLQRCLDTYTQSFDRREKFSMEYRLRYRDGEYRWILDVGVPRFNEDGSFAGYIGIGVDVSDRRLAEQERLSSENRFRQFFETMPEYCYMVSPNGEIIDANLAVCTALGYTKDELVGKPLSTLYAPECAPKMRKVFEKWRTDGEVRNEEMVVITKQGQRRTVLLNVGSVRDSDGNILHSTSVQVDITERKMAEERLRESEEQFRTLAEAIPQLCWMAHGDGHIFWYNQRWYTYTGTTPEQMEGWGWQSVHDPRALPLVLERWKTSIATREPFDMVFPIRAADGVFHPFLTRITPVKDSKGSVVRWFGTNTDVTELRDATEAVRASEERLRLAQQIARIGSFDWNVQTGVNTWTPELEAMYGLQPGAFGETQTAFENLVHADDRAGVIKLVDRALKTGRSTDGEWRAVLSDGSVRWIAGRWQVLMNESGVPARMIGVNIDVTERKRAEVALLEVNRRLIEAQEQERARIGRDLHDDIGQRLALLAIQLQQFREDTLILPEVRSRMGELQKQISEIATDIQSLSHELHSAKLEYLGIVAAMRGFCQEFAENQKAEIDFKAHDLPSPLSPDISLCLFRVLQEALHNSAKHSGVRQFEVRLWGTSDEIHLTVKDSGAGFDCEAAKESRGLGLISMEERLKLVKGTLSINSQPKRGTTIDARAPLNSGSDSMRAAG
jgi:PAS domain S-box-containing protein